MAQIETAGRPSAGAARAGPSLFSASLAPVALFVLLVAAPSGSGSALLALLAAVLLVGALVALRRALAERRSRPTGARPGGRGVAARVADQARRAAGRLSAASAPARDPPADVGHRRLPAPARHRDGRRTIARARLRASSTPRRAAREGVSSASALLALGAPVLRRLRRRRAPGRDAARDTARPTLYIAAGDARRCSCSSSSRSSTASRSPSPTRRSTTPSKPLTEIWVGLENYAQHPRRLPRSPSAPPTAPSSSTTRTSTGRSCFTDRLDGHERHDRRHRSGSSSR